jgi:hypothetical protein
MAYTTSKGLYVWDLESDKFDHTQLRDNWDTINSLLGGATDSITTSATVPTVDNFAGRVIMLTADTGGFSAWTLIRYDGSAWRPVSSLEVTPIIPVTGNFAGRVVILSAAVGGFAQWNIIRYDGSAWELVGGWSKVNTGGLASNIVGVQQSGDAYISNSARGFVLIDRTTGVKRRLYFDSGNLISEVVT